MSQTNQLVVPLTPLPLILRQCGIRGDGGIYHQVEKVDLTEQARCLLLCPPVPITGLNLSNQGINLIKRPDGSGIYDAWDVVGLNNYPWVWDFIMEVDEVGLSRKFNQNVLDKLTPGKSIHFLVHARARVEDMNVYSKWPDKESWGNCPKDIKLHNPQDKIETCLTLARLSQIPFKKPKGSKIAQDLIDPNNKNFYRRGLECGASYPAGVANKLPEFTSGIFMRVKVNRFDIVHGQGSTVESSNDAAERLKQLGFSFRITNA